jgi:hypothetical protein
MNPLAEQKIKIDRIDMIYGIDWAISNRVNLVNPVQLSQSI